MTRAGERQETYSGELPRIDRIAARLGCTPEALREAILAESPLPGKSGLVTLTLRPGKKPGQERRVAQRISITETVSATLQKAPPGATMDSVESEAR